MFRALPLHIIKKEKEKRKKGSLTFRNGLCRLHDLDVGQAGTFDNHGAATEIALVHTVLRDNLRGTARVCRIVTSYQHRGVTIVLEQLDDGFARIDTALVATQGFAGSHDLCRSRVDTRTADQNHVLLELLASNFGGQLGRTV